jgi:hypothetical protein
MRLEANMELAMTIHRYTTVSTDRKKTCNVGFLCVVSACSPNHHLQGECEVEGGSGPLFKPLVGRKGRMWSVFLSDLKAAFTCDKTTLITYPHFGPITLSASQSP